MPGIRYGVWRKAALATGILLLLLAFDPRASQAQLRGGLPGLGRAPVGAPTLGAPGVSTDHLPGSNVLGGPNHLGLPDISSPQLPRARKLDPLVPQKDRVTNTLSGPIRDLPAASNRNPAAAPRRGQRQLSGVPRTGERRFLPDEVVVSLPSNVSPGAINALARRHRLTLLDSQAIAVSGRTYHRWRISDGRSVSDVIRTLEADGGTGEAQAQPSYRFTLQQPASLQSVAMGDISIQYAPGKLHVPEAHRFAAGTGVVIAIIDSGVDSAHAEIAGAVEDTFDAVGSQQAAQAHGTAIAGVIAAKAKLKGIAPAARILAIRAFDGSNKGADGTTLTVLRSIDWAVVHGARIINMSFAGPQDPAITRALAAAKKKGIVLVAAAGNAGANSSPLYPAADPNVIAVTATDAQDKLFSASNRGRHIAVAAPGVELVMPAPRDRYQVSSGTSFAAAHITGVIALLLEIKPGLKPDAVRIILESSAKDLGPKGRDNLFGAGLVDAYRAILALNAAHASGNARLRSVSE